MIGTTYISNSAVLNGKPYTLYYRSTGRTLEGTNVERRLHHIGFFRSTDESVLTLEQRYTLRNKKVLPNVHDLLAWPFVGQLEHIVIAKYGRYFTMTAISSNDREQYKIRTKNYEEVESALHQLTRGRIKMGEKTLEYENPFFIVVNNKAQPPPLDDFESKLADIVSELEGCEALLRGDGFINSDAMILMRRAFNIAAQVNELLEFVAELKKNSTEDIPPS